MWNAPVLQVRKGDGGHCFSHYRCLRTMHFRALCTCHQDALTAATWSSLLLWDRSQQVITASLPLAGTQLAWLLSVSSKSTKLGARPRCSVSIWWPNYAWKKLDLPERECAHEKLSCFLRLISKSDFFPLPCQPQGSLGQATYLV